MEAVLVECVHEDHHPASLRHALAEIQVLADLDVPAVSSDLQERGVPEHDRAVGKGWKVGPSQQHPPVAGPNPATLPIDAFRERSHQDDVGVITQDRPLAGQPLRVRDVVRVHPRAHGGGRQPRNPVRAPRPSLPGQAPREADARVSCRPAFEDRRGVVRRRVVENDELEVPPRLADDAADGRVEVGAPIVHGHDHADRGACTRVHRAVSVNPTTDTAPDGVLRARRPSLRVHVERNGGVTARS